ncbi:uncharacterized protein TRIADDRAFT_57913 [Trichoplax adhaerens]|uniref:U1-type domain-containing protein n=1 Tax=Trichoplax adhaerens TaxID=10228 RepID=B3S237_TRIAD|nr:hypothetical protein TRIADDRAFT_57913 [Trichoplax adhaerens]EDV23364.1 hypothetical protein TRIADDRAFT_57913 [Trichoplax adhaerens]|eukprot:XP_002114274.1 hypothetical protein TRIADDRAFT_57913 [Trichoplax adhaerens]
MKRQKLPIVVGGTNYYIEALLWDYLIKEENISADETNANDYQNKPLSDDTEKKSANSYEELKLLDPERAAMLHPNDTRKILRSLEIIKRNQVKHSSYIERQRQQPGGSFYSGPLRFSSAAIFLLECDQNVLDQKLDARCDEMIEKGLLRELYTFYQDWQVHSGSRPVNTEIGLFQSIGFKQFMPYLQLIEKEECSLDTKGPSDNVPAIYSFDVTPNSLKSEILERSVSITKALIEGKTPTESPVRKYTGYSEISNRLQRFTCDLCNVTVIGEKSWIAHKGSRRHRYSLRKIRRDSKSS